MTNRKAGRTMATHSREDIVDLVENKVVLLTILGHKHVYL